MRRTLLLTLLLSATAASPAVKAQWDIQDSGTKASLRGIHSLGKGIAWASGTDGTVLRTEDNGAHWLPCATPPDAEKLDFRGIQAFDNKTAIVMSSGKGDASRLYKTTDACQTWSLLFTNPDPEGFWDGIKFTAKFQDRFGEKLHQGVVIGDPVNGEFAVFETNDSGAHWEKRTGPFYPVTAREGEALFAASNSSFILIDDEGEIDGEIFVTGGTQGSRSRVRSEYVKHDPQVSVKFVGGDLPLASGESAGAFSIATSHGAMSKEERLAEDRDRIYFFPTKALCVAVGGDYKKPDKGSGTAAYSSDGGRHWKSPKSPPHGYRSSVAYDPTTKTWITVGPNGTDISTDDGRNWRALKPGPNDALDADKNWNALSLPFVVGPKGRIGVLRPDALKAPPSK
jgi:photosystem II stability/assembly factor-like uncharacterized protein